MKRRHFLTQAVAATAAVTLAPTALLAAKPVANVPDGMTVYEHEYVKLDELKERYRIGCDPFTTGTAVSCTTYLLKFDTVTGKIITTKQLT